MYGKESIMGKYRLAAPCLFGIEGILADELRRMGAEGVSAENGRVFFDGDDEMIARANIRSRFAERILLVIGSFEATSFTELFDSVKALPLESYIRMTDAFPVKGHSIDSTLHSVPDCQAIIKKAAVERLKTKYGIDRFPETGAKVQLQFSIFKDKVTLMIDTSGRGLHKRGYRALSNAAPIRETLAAAMCDQARIYHDTRIYDPFCGSGTLLIEAAMMAASIAPGLHGFFAAEKFSFISAEAWKKEREAAYKEVNTDIEFHGHGYDIDPECIRLSRENAEKAGVGKLLSFEVADVRDFKGFEDRGLVVTNPPYGERLLDVKAAEELYTVMGKSFVRERGKKYFIISPHDEFESFFGRPADKRRKLYNGMIKCQLYMYFK